MGAIRKTAKRIGGSLFVNLLALVAFVATFLACTAIVSAVTDTDEKSQTSDVFTVPTPAETTAPAGPSVVPTPFSSTEIMVPAEAPAVAATEPDPQSQAAPEAPVAELPAEDPAPLPEGWTAPQNPGEPPRAPAEAAPEAPCLPGEGGERCAPTGG